MQVVPECDLCGESFLSDPQVFLRIFLPFSWPSQLLFLSGFENNTGMCRERMYHASVAVMPRSETTENE